MIPLIFYIYILTGVIILVAILGVFAITHTKINKLSKIGLVWYIIILELNLINITGVLKFYNKNKFRKGKKGPKGERGPLGFKGQNELCSSCGLAGKQNEVYAGIINDKGQKVISNDVVQGKCIFPFIHDYKYQYECSKDKPPNSETNDASLFGWCPTKINSDFETVTYAYCNENASIHDRLRKEKQYRQNRKDYIQNNRGILDIDIVIGNTLSDARNQCERKLNYEFDETDLNQGTGGKFVHMCIKRGLGNQGISDLKVKDFPSDNQLSQVPNPANADLGVPTNELNMYTGINVDLNVDSGPNADGDYPQLFMYKKRATKNFIKDIVARRQSKGGCPQNYVEVAPDLNLGTHNTTTDALKLCISKRSANVLAIDTAFVYKDNHLYVFRGNYFYKLSNKVAGNSIKVIDNYPKTISEKWSRQDSNGESVKSCKVLNTENKCRKANNCLWDSVGNTCEETSNYDAAFTYGYNNKTYFFQGSLVFLYDDKNMKIANGYPKKIEDVFKGIPNNINAVFTWGKDGKTYFFKGPYYYKYNDQNKKVERGYPKKTNTRWRNMPKMIDAIFTLKTNLGDGNDNNPTYVISGERSWHIDPVSDALISQKNIDERFMGLEASFKDKINPLATTPTTTSSVSTTTN